MREVPLTFRQLQEEQKPWVAHNFPTREPWNPLMGMVEELGELAHAHLKEHQQIRKGEDHVANAKDAVGDILIYMSDYCSARGFDLQQIIEETWDKVRQRDWKKKPDDAHKGLGDAK